MKTYEQRVRKLEREGLTRSDAQGVVDAEDLKASRKVQHTPGLPRNRLEGLMSEAADKMNELYAERDRLKAVNAELVAALNGVLQSAGYENGVAEPSLRELRVHRTRLDAARAALAKARQ